MFILRRLLMCSLPFVPVLLTGCGTVGEDRFGGHSTEGGFTVLVDGPDHPAATRVAGDIGAFAQSRGFVRQPSESGPPTDPLTHESIPHAPDRYTRGSLQLDVSYQPTTHRVSAYLRDYSSVRERKSIRGFYRDFHKEFAPRYGERDPISESAFSGDQPNGSGDTFTPPAPGINDTRSVGMGRGQ